MVFVELTPFVAFCKEYWTDEDLRAMQNFLLEMPDAGDLIRGGAGLRKLRWSAQGSEDLTSEQIKVLKALMKDIEHG
jgi:hypothetical protein